MGINEISPTKTGWVYETIKRTFDIVFSAAILIICAPLMLLITVLIRLDSPGGAIFKQIRIGKDRRRLKASAPGNIQERQLHNLNGIPFTIYKFRTMYCNMRSAQNGEVTEDIDIVPNDPAITRVGKVLRYLSLDELPQLFNVLKGDMSIVGPRPTIPSQTEIYDARSCIRQKVKPGITGLAQVSGRNSLTWEQRIEKDIEYVANQSISQDIEILFKTIKVVLNPTDVY